MVIIAWKIKENDMNTKIRIDLAQGIIEAEGNEDFVKIIYNDFKEKISSPKNLKSKNSPNQPITTLPKSSPIKQIEHPQKRKTGNSNPKMINDLDLSGSTCGTSLRDFYDKYKAKSNFEKNLLFLYYLKNIMKEDKISIDHIFTCYRNISGIKIPGNLEQSIRDTRTKKSWIEYKKIDELSITVHGINYVEHDMKKRD